MNNTTRHTYKKGQHNKHTQIYSTHDKHYINTRTTKKKQIQHNNTEITKHRKHEDDKLQETIINTETHEYLKHNNTDIHNTHINMKTKQTHNININATRHNYEIQN